MKIQGAKMGSLEISDKLISAVAARFFVSQLLVSFSVSLNVT